MQHHPCLPKYMVPMGGEFATPLCYDVGGRLETQEGAMEDALRRAVEDLTADYLRQGKKLELDQVHRLLSRRGLAEAEPTVLSELEARGVVARETDAALLGFRVQRPPSVWRRPADPPSVDGLGVFLRDAGKHRLLTESDEQRLARRIRLGAHALELLNLDTRSATLELHSPPLARQFRLYRNFVASGRVDRQSVPKELRRQVVSGHKAFTQVVLTNLRLVVNIASQRQWTGSVELVDRVQSGCLGLIRAVEKFDPDLGYRFSTYATWWIRQTIARAIADTGSTIRLPVHLVERRSRYHRVKRSLQIELRREPSLEEMARDLQWDVADVAAFEDLYRFDVTSLDVPIGENDDVSRGDLIADPFSSDPEDVVVAHAVAEAVDTMLGTLTDRERWVLELRFGVGDGRTRTLHEVGQELGVTRERIRQIESKALGKLRQATVSGKYGDLLDLKARRRAPDEATTANNDNQESDS